MATAGGVREYGVRLKVGATGLEQAQAVGRALRELGVDTSALDARAEQLNAELARLGKEQGLIESFSRQKQAAENSAKALQTAQEAAQRLGREFAAAEGPTKAQGAALDKARAAVVAAKDAQLAANLELAKSRDALRASGIASDDVAAAQVRVRQQSEQARQGVAGLTKAYDAVDAAARGAIGAQSQLGTSYTATATAARNSAAGQVTANERVQASLQSLQGQMRTVQTLAAAVLGGTVATGLSSQVYQIADDWKNLQARIKLVTGEGPAFQAAFEGVYGIAKRTNSEFAATAELYTKIARAGKELSLGNQEVLALTETINQAVQLSGASAEASKAAITQLVQGLGSGVLRGDEFNSVMEQSPRLAQALADGLGLPIGKLRALAEAGTLTSETVIRSLQGQSAAIQAEFAQLPPTVGRAVTNLTTEMRRYVAEVDAANGFSDSMARRVQFLASHLQEVAAVLFSLGKAALAYKAVGLAQAFIEKAAAARAATVAGVAETQATQANTAAAGANTVALAANTAARTRNAAAWAELAAGLTATAGAARAATTSVAAAGTATAAATGQVVATGAAAASAAASVGSFATILSSLKTFTLLGVITNFREIGTFIGEGIAKLVGYKDKNDEILAQQRLEEESARRLAQAKADQAAKTKLVQEASLGLNEVSRKIVAEYSELRSKGESAADALAKVQDKLKLSDVQGITDAVTALDVLRKRGEITAEAMQKALGSALKGIDLGSFEVNAKAAFDGSAQGVQRLKAAIAALADESLRRAGTSVRELKTGFSEALVSAQNDTDKLRSALRSVGAESQQASRLVAASLGKEIDLATTERSLTALVTRIKALGEQGQLSAVQVADALGKVQSKFAGIDAGAKFANDSVRELATGTTGAMALAAGETNKVAASIKKLGLQGEEAGRIVNQSLGKEIDLATTERGLINVRERLQQLGAQGVISGRQVADALEKIDLKIGEIKPGINNLAEAMKQLGIRSTSTLNEIAQNSRQAFQIALDSGKVSLQELANGFNKLRDDAIAANNGIEPSWVRQYELILKARIAASGLGEELQAAMNDGRKAIEGTNTALAILLRNMQTVPNSIGAISNSLGSNGGSSGNNRPRGGGYTPPDRSGNLSVLGPGGGAISYQASGQLQPPDNSGDWWFNTARRDGPYGLGAWELTPEAQARMAAENAAFLADARANDPGGFNGGAGYSPFGRAGRRSGKTEAGGSGQEVQPPQGPTPITINLGDYTARVQTSEADRLVALLRASQQRFGG